MSGPFGAGALQYFSGAKGFYPHEIDQSVRFNGGDNPYLSRTPSSAGNRKTWTWSGWIKRSSLQSASPYGGLGIIFAGGNEQNMWAIPANCTLIAYWINTEQLAVVGTGNTTLRLTTARQRDLSGWYHLVVAMDTTQASANDRTKVYINGVQQTSFDTTNNVAQNTDLNINEASNHFIGGQQTVNAAAYMNMYLAETHFIDGQALSASSFGETKEGIWIPKEYTGSYGTNGFKLAFQDSSALGDDTSGNGNDFTANNLAATDQVLDSPTNNFAVMNPLDPPVGTSVTLAEGNSKVTGSTSSYSGAVASTFEVDSGKWYWEFYVNNEVSAGSNHYSFVGAATGDNNEVHKSNNSNVPSLATGVDGWSWEGDGSINLIGTGTKAVSSVSAPSAGDVLGFAMDLDNGNVYFYLNGTAQNSGSAVITGVTGLNTNPMAGVYNASAVTSNFGQDSTFAGAETAGGNSDENGIGDFQYAVPSGYLALCTANLPDPGIDPNTGDDPAEYFNTVLYTGTGSTQSITGVGFQPDWVWVKRRSAAGDHILSDSVRTAGKYLSSNLSAAEITSTDFGSFDSDGFTVNATDQTGGLNVSSNTYAAWNWKAGGTAVNNTQGSIASSVSASTEAGFSIVSYTGSGTNGATVGHGLSSKPEFFVIKNRDASTNWIVYVEALGATKNLALESSGAAITSATRFNNTEPTSSVFSLGTTTAVNGSSTDYIAYCFHSVDGYSKIGSYTGNSSTDGPFIYTGFKPAFILAKKTSGTDHWFIHDVKRSVSNPTTFRLFPNLNNAESTVELESTYGIDFLSNGFKIRASHTSTNIGDFIYMAFAEQPFKYSNAR